MPKVFISLLQFFSFFLFLFFDAQRKKGRYKNRRTGGHISFGIVFVCAHNLTNRIRTQLHLPEEICSPESFSFLFFFFSSLLFHIDIVMVLDIVCCQYCIGIFASYFISSVPSYDLPRINILNKDFIAIFLFFFFILGFIFTLCASSFIPVHCNSFRSLMRCSVVRF